MKVPAPKVKKSALRVPKVSSKLPSTPKAPQLSGGLKGFMANKMQGMMA